MSELGPLKVVLCQPNDWKKNVCMIVGIVSRVLLLFGYEWLRELKHIFLNQNISSSKFIWLLGWPEGPNFNTGSPIAFQFGLKSTFGWQHKLWKLSLLFFAVIGYNFSSFLFFFVSFCSFSKPSFPFPVVSTWNYALKKRS